MATYNEDITLLAFAQVDVTTEFPESITLASVASVALDEDIGAVSPVTLLAVASVAVEAVVAHQVNLDLQAYAQVSVFDESLGAIDLLLLASAQILIEVETHGLDEDLMLLTFADITLDLEVQKSELTRSSGGMFGAAPPVRVRQDIAPYLTPTPTRRTKFPTQG